MEANSEQIHRHSPLFIREKNCNQVKLVYSEAEVILNRRV